MVPKNDTWGQWADTTFTPDPTKNEEQDKHTPEKQLAELLQQNRELVEGLRELLSIIPKEIDPFTVAEFIHKCLDARNKAEELLKKYDNKKT